MNHFPLGLYTRQLLGTPDKFIVQHNVGSHYNLFSMCMNFTLCVYYTRSNLALAIAFIIASFRSNP